MLKSDIVVAAVIINIIIVIKIFSDEHGSANFGTKYYTIAPVAVNAFCVICVHMWEAVICENATTRRIAIVVDVIIEIIIRWRWGRVSVREGINPQR